MGKNRSFIGILYKFKGISMSQMLLKRLDGILLFLSFERELTD